MKACIWLLGSLLLFSVSPMPSWAAESLPRNLGKVQLGMTVKQLIIATSISETTEEGIENGAIKKGTRRFTVLNPPEKCKGLDVNVSERGQIVFMRCELQYDHPIRLIDFYSEKHGFLAQNYVDYPKQAREGFGNNTVERFAVRWYDDKTEIVLGIHLRIATWGIRDFSKYEKQGALPLDTSDGLTAMLKELRSSYHLRRSAFLLVMPKE